MPERLMWTALPNGVAGADRRLRLSVLVSPRLTTADGADGVLSQFPDLRHWTSTMAATSFAVELDGVIVADRLRPRNTLEPALWDALFTDQTAVRSHVFTDYSGHQLISYPVRRLRDRIQELYAGVAFQSPLGLPAIEETDPVGGLRFTLAALGFLPERPPPTPPPAPPTPPPPPSGPAAAPALSVESAAENVAAFRRFYDRPARPNAPLPQTPEELARLLDFHQALACLSDYPVLLRRLGLVFDLEIPATLPATAPRELRVRPRWTPVDPASPTPDICPATKAIWDGSTFAAVPSRPGIQQGLLVLGEESFDLVDVDVDGTVHKLVNLALNLEAISSRDAADRPRTAALPALHTAGLSLVRDARAGALTDHLARMSAHNKVLEGPTPENVVFDAEQLVRGYRIDIWDSRSQAWHTLCRRIGTYRFEHTGLERRLEDEGFVQLAAAGVPAQPGQPPAAPELYLHESLLRWTGWSLVAPRPGKAISADSDPAAAPERPDNAAVTSLGLQTTFAAAVGSLPRLRYGVGYRLRARVVDLAGNSRSLAEAGDLPALPATAPGRVYLRYEAVPSPIVVLRQGLSGETDPGESLDRIVIRSVNVGEDHDDVPSTDAAERHIAPPRTTPALAEAHGAFDDPTGRVKGDAATYRMIQARDAAQLNQDGDVPIMPDEQMVVAYLPDVLARGAALRDLPGAPRGTIGTPDVAGRLTYRQADVQPDLSGLITRLGFEPTSVTQIDFGPASDWPAMQPFRLVLREGTGPPAWDAQQRVLTVAMPKGEVAQVALSCYCHRTDLELLGVWDWIRKLVDAQSVRLERPLDLALLSEDVVLLTQRALEGGHWALTPARTLVLVHAVQQPLGRPIIDELVAQRDFGATSARLTGTIRVHPSSTGKVDLVGRWNEVPGVGPEPPRPAEDAAAELRLHHRRGSNLLLFADRPVADYDPGTGTVRMDGQHHPRHEFGDTRHRVARYRAVAASRFSEYFLRQVHVELGGTRPEILNAEGIAPHSETARSTDGATTFTRVEDGAGDYEVDYRSGTIARSAGSRIGDGQSVRVEFLPPVSRDSDEVVVHVPSSARPAAPRVLYVVPAFEWHRQTSTNLLASRRRGGWLRVYLEGPWFSSGEGEQLGVVVSRGVSEPQGQLARYVTRMGSDVLRPPAATSSLSHFSQGKRDFGPGLFGLTLEELEPTHDNRVNVFGYDVAFDAERALWYCDIQTSSGAFEPFIRLALARYQPHSVVEFDPDQPEKLRDVKLSRVVLADVVQLHANRSVLVTYDPYRPARLRVVVSGASYGRTFQSEGPSRIEVSVQEREPGLEGDLAWVRAADVVVEPDPATPTQPATVLWRGEVVLPLDRAIADFRVVVEEFDTLPADDSNQPAPLLYADVLELAALGAAKPDSHTTLVSSPNPSDFGQAVAITATVSGAGAATPTGQVTFTAGSRQLGRVSLAGGVAVLNVADLPVGSHRLTCSYSGDASFGPSRGAVAHVVERAATRIDITPRLEIHGKTPF
ncbi:Ig-like domain-containing protein [Saccharothrix deserti]|uniref:Ig-like domain-containing protein n=1 Tax=Saccharothrix deserti TaxID=2593674 RepID=UPI00131B29E3|nr:Ig-like domain-containing protein [Saccharothrix deserti]